MKKCIVCGAPLGKPILTCSGMPASAQNIPDESEVKFDSGIDLDLCACPKCGLVQFDCEPVDYYRDTIRAGGFTQTMVDLRRSQYDRFIKKYNLTGKKFVEVGCGRGEFLKVLTEFPVEAYGIENRESLVDIAVQNGLNVKKNFTESTDTVIEGGPFDAFLSFNFLEHQPYPNTMLSCIYNNLTEGGYGLITVPSFEYILKNDGYYELLHDHIVYFTQDTLAFLFEKNGFKVLESRLCLPDTIEVIVQKKSAPNVKGLERNRGALKKDFAEFVNEKIQHGKKVAIWGASHQGFTIAATTEMGEKIEYIIDSAPFKQGRYAPASHIKIVSPDYSREHPVDCIIIVAPGYTDEIAQIIKTTFDKVIEIAAIRSSVLERDLRSGGGVNSWNTSNK